MLPIICTDVDWLIQNFLQLRKRAASHLDISLRDKNTFAPTTLCLVFIYINQTLHPHEVRDLFPPDI